MIISHQYKFIFIKTQKTAGTSIEVYLSQVCGAGDVVTPVYPPEEGHQPRNYQGWWNPLPEIIMHRGRGLQMTFSQLRQRQRYFNHMPARLARARLSPQIWDEYYKFCVERNPWDKTLSHYAMRRERLGGELSLEQYFARGNFCVNYGLYTDRGGKLLVDRVLRYERLDDELGEVFARLGIPYTGSLGVKAKTSHSRDRRPYQEIFTAAQLTRLSEVFAAEIRLHGYQF